MTALACWLRTLVPEPVPPPEPAPALATSPLPAPLEAEATTPEPPSEPSLASGMAAAMNGWATRHDTDNVIAVRLRPEERPRGPTVLEPEEVAEAFYGDRSRRWVALTFDDGPSRENTPRILDILEHHDVHATFFVLGRRVRDMPELTQDIHERGHELGNHSWSHGSFRSLWKSEIVEELTRTGDAIFDVVGLYPALVRPPYGRYAPSAVPVFGSLGMHAILWSVDSHDWDEPDPQVIARHVVEGAHDGSIVLLHDRASTTVHALPHILRGLEERGFEIVPVSQLTGYPAYREVKSDEDESHLGSSVIMASTFDMSARDKLRSVSHR